MNTVVMIFIFGLWNLFNTNNNDFDNLICSYDEDSLSVYNYKMVITLNDMG